MLSMISEWIKHVILLIFLATFLDLLLPNNSMRRYVRLVVGLLLLLVILTPVLNVFQFDYQAIIRAEEQLGQTEAAWLQKVASHQQDIEAWQERQVVQEAERELARELKKMLEDAFPIDLQAVRVDWQSGSYANMERLELQLRLLSEEQERQREQSVTGHLVQPVQIVVDLESSSEKLTKIGRANLSAQENKLTEEIVSYLHQEWNISVDKIGCTWVR